MSWLEELGLKNLISRYSLPKLLEWGWLVPKYKCSFPAEYFEEVTPENFDRIQNQPRHNDPIYRLLGYGESWQIENTEDTYWFLHPFFRADSDYSNLLNQTDSSAMPNVYYFFHWQAYALIDVVRIASMGAFPILNTPDIEEDIASISNCKIQPSDALNQLHRWGGFAKPMTWISHYRAFRNALSDIDDRAKRKALHKQGAEALALYLEIDAEVLEKAIKEQLLQELAGSWLKTNYDCEEWTLQAWPYLQKDIFFAMEWLCALNGKSFNDYFKKWQFSHKREVWPPFHKVLPFEYFEDRQYFLATVPHYKKFYNGILPTDEKLEQLVTRLQQTNYLFDSLLNAFRQFHEHLMYKPQKKGSLDFRVLRPLDYYSLLAIRAETCLRYALEKSGSLSGMPDSEQKLEGYIIKLAPKILSDKSIRCLKNQVKAYTKLHDTANMPNPIRSIMDISYSNRSKKDTYLIKAFLSCVLARNYFAHHTYLDNEFMQNQREESAFMLIGVLVTVLKLLDD
ncbi:hypothetical protein [Methylotuvimicrobium sp. KM1]|uniref:hypothetical protein n=1 Tax=Methylotuvimicrobium sp. KM1 TaxID=3377707 RepID=UPI00384CC748